MNSIETVLEVKQARKAFGYVKVLDGVDLTVKRGEVVALLGDNGAGKSTLVKAISGIVELDDGEISLEQKTLHLRTAADARNVGIETVFQHLAVLDNLDVCSNFFIGREEPWPRWLGPLGLLNHNKMAKSWEKHATELGIKVLNPFQEIGLMSGGQRQAVAVARAVAFASKVVILDEPTAALGVKETAQVLDLIKRLPAKGVSVILISHNMEQVTEVANRAVVLRHGRIAGEMVPRKENIPDLIGMIMGTNYSQVN